MKHESLCFILYYYYFFLPLFLSISHVTKGRTSLPAFSTAKPIWKPGHWQARRKQGWTAAFPESRYLAVSAGNPLGRGHPWMFPNRDFTNSSWHLRRLKGLQTSGQCHHGAAAAAGVFLPSPFLCASPTDVTWRIRSHFIYCGAVLHRAPDDVNDPAGSFLFHFVMPYMQHCYGNMELMLHFGREHLVWFHSSFWSTASCYESFWMARTAEQTERSTAHPYPSPVFSQNRTWLTSGSTTVVKPSLFAGASSLCTSLACPSAPHWAPSLAMPCSSAQKGFPLLAHICTLKAHSCAWKKCPKF